MAEELRRLQERVRELEAEQAQLHQEREAGPSLRGQVDNPGTTETVIYLPREQKCPMFRGTHGIGIDDWVEEVPAISAVEVVSLPSGVHEVRDERDAVIATVRSHTAKRGSVRENILGANVTQQRHLLASSPLSSSLLLSHWPRPEQRGFMVQTKQIR
uniref:Uncharacterized protein n=1 Tax=Knipowitschia caucasica TaxID=637954 RepID=A0AAV2KN49_KNICA